MEAILDVEREFATQGQLEKAVWTRRQAADCRMRCARLPVGVEIVRRAPVPGDDAVARPGASDLRGRGAPAAAVRAAARTAKGGSRLASLGLRRARSPLARPPVPPPAPGGPSPP
eukprot:CAMPEP_0171198016 /NCGR_PEP_ID=MMETSP0790-20130122/22709_1 /TAXON_ID=2925 /ORGANISM="Alexandrium catenella, Strain OF101" /LENGTH=114 /DNA_ID=CAMNT_0011663275 /DNA_START=193 /DNA_END=535 /DNA_ORIENTATION=-